MRDDSIKVGSSPCQPKFVLQGTLEKVCRVAMEMFFKSKNKMAIIFFRKRKYSMFFDENNELSL